MENARNKIKKQNKNKDVRCAGKKNKKRRQQNINGISNKETTWKGNYEQQG